MTLIPDPDTQYGCCQITRGDVERVALLLEDRLDLPALGLTEEQVGRFGWGALTDEEMQTLAAAVDARLAADPELDLHDTLDAVLRRPPTSSTGTPERHDAVRLAAAP